MIDLNKYPLKACEKRDGEMPHTVDKATSRCVECGKAVVHETNPDRWEVHPADE